MSLKPDAGSETTSRNVKYEEVKIWRTSRVVLVWTLGDAVKRCERFGDLNV